MRVIVTGAGVGGLTTAMLLAGDGHDVTVVERDPMPPPDDADGSWTRWTRPGVNQFRLLHFFQAAFRELAEAELPAVVRHAEALGALRINPVAAAPHVAADPLPGDARYEIVTARRPVMETALARAAEDAAVEVRRGVATTGLVTGAAPGEGIPHVVGVRTSDGDDLHADLVVDATGRRSPLPAWLEAAGARPPVEEREDCGFVYWGRHFRSSDGSVPPALGPYLQTYGTVSVLTLPADNGTWGVGVVTSARDRALRRLRDVDVWTAIVRSFPLLAHWVDGEPLDDTIAVMAGIEDRHRAFVVDGRPVATGVLAVADSWACTNPSVGRGASIGLRHALALRDLLRDAAGAEPIELAAAWATTTAATVEPWYRVTLAYDRARLAEIHAALDGGPPPDDPTWEFTRALEHASRTDATVLRAFAEIAGVLSLPQEALAAPGVVERVLQAGAGWRDAPLPGPDRAGLVAIAGG